MSHILIGIYDEDTVYGKRLMEYINRQKVYPLTAAAFTTAEGLKEFMEQQDVRGAILAEGTPVSTDKPVYYLKRDQSSESCRYGNARQIIKEAYSVFNPGRQRAAGVTGIYSPAENRKRTGFALQTARETNALYFGMESYGRAGTEGAMENLLFAVKVRKDQIADLVRESSKDINGVRGFPSARCFLDYREISAEDYRWLFQKLAEADISAVLDMETACIYDFSLFSLCDYLYLPVWEEDMEDPRLLGFKEVSEQHPILSALNWKEVFLS
ncbi:hypothetical protein [Anaerostipes sp.]|uniref:hypothetical protein n=1 Tax=Anaerostipes sp. TaxID=1872530 RepID=UPI0025C03C32|nr:hypothetical protein [Anaerostipes sp.]MBS7008948.1 hypothetical protein [Anaerostipes sp.]